MSAGATLTSSRAASAPTERVLDAAKRCCERWGMSKVTIDDIAAEAGISRATLYRLFPGGRDVLFEALRLRETTEFFAELDVQVHVADSLAELVVGVVVEATQQLRADEHLQLVLASEPGSVAASLSFEGLPAVFETATAYLAPRVAPWIGEARAAELAELLSRLVVSYFLVPSRFVDLGDPGSASRFLGSFVLPSFVGGSSAPAPSAPVPTKGT